MTNSIRLIQSLDTPITTKRDSEALLRSADRTQPVKSRRQRRREERDRAKTIKTSQK